MKKQKCSVWTAVLAVLTMINLYFGAMTGVVAGGGGPTPVFPGWEDDQPQVFGSVAYAPDSMPVTKLALFEHVIRTTQRSWVTVNDDRVLQNPGTIMSYYNQSQGQVQNREAVQSLGSGYLSFESPIQNSDTSLFGVLETETGYPNFWGEGTVYWYFNEQGRLEVGSVMDFKMGEFVQMDSHGAMNARIIVHDEYGHPQTFWLASQGGHFYFPAYYVENSSWNDQLVLQFPDGDASYGIGAGYGGRRMPVLNVGQFVEATLSESVSATNNANIIVNKYQYSDGVNPIVELMVDEVGVRWGCSLSCVIPARPDDGRFAEEWATSVIIRFPDGSEYEDFLNTPNHVVYYQLEGGVYTLQFKFDSGFGESKPGKVPRG